MKILITNDDGWGARGILTLAEEMRRLGDVLVVAPDGPRSGQSNAITVAAPIRLNKLEELPAADGLGAYTVYTCSGTPSDCVKIALEVLIGDDMLQQERVLVVSGINHGDNGTINVIYSGTMGGVFVGAEHDLPAIGFSICDHDPQVDFSYFRTYLVPLTEKILRVYDSLSKEERQSLCWNVNAPVGPIEGVRLTRQTHGFWHKEFATYHDPSGRPFYMLTGEYVNLEPEAEDTDQYATSHHLISVTPTTVDMTLKTCPASISIGSAF